MSRPQQFKVGARCFVALTWWSRGRGCCPNKSGRRPRSARVSPGGPSVIITEGYRRRTPCRRPTHPVFTSGRVTYSVLQKTLCFTGLCARGRCNVSKMEKCISCGFYKGGVGNARRADVHNHFFWVMGARQHKWHKM